MRIKVFAITLMLLLVILFLPACSNQLLKGEQKVLIDDNNLTNSNEKMLEIEELAVQKPVITKDMSTGAGLELGYESDKYVVFHGYFGLFIYDIQSKEIIAELDLKSINCADVYGDNASTITFSEENMIATVRTMNQKEFMYEFNIQENLLARVPFKNAEDRNTKFNGELVPSANVGDITYHINDKKYQIFERYDFR